MVTEFPYQLVTFLGNKPKIGEQIYSSANGWYPQIALKRRFALNDTSEQEFIDELEEYLGNQNTFFITTKQLIKPLDMPVKVIEIERTQAVMEFHRDFIAHFDSMITSKYPDREGDNYYPHITAEYYDRIVIDTEEFIDREFEIDTVCLVKDDPATDDSRAHKYFDLKD